MPQRTLFGRPFGIGLILIQKAVWGTVLLAIGVGLLVLHAMNETQPFQELFEGELASDPHDVLANLVIGLLPSLSLRTELVIAAGAWAYALLEAIEGWGLWRGLAWVEVLVLVETGAFIPYEIWELIRQVTPFKIGSIVINVLIVWYLAARYRRKRLGLQPS